MAAHPARVQLPKEPQGPHRPMTAPSGGRNNVIRSRPFYNNDLSLKITGDRAGRYTFDSARTRPPPQFRPMSAVTQDTQRTQDTGRTTGRPSTAVTRRRYFFPQKISMQNTGAKKSPFYSHFDVQLPADDQNSGDEQGSALSYRADQRGHQAFYYRDYNQHQLEHFAQNRDLAPLQVDVDELRDWLVSAKPRTAMDAGPLLVLCQNLLKSVLEEKSIVFERRAEQHQQEKDAVVQDLTKRITALEGELQNCRKERQVADSSAQSFKEKLLAAQEKIDSLQKQVEHGREVVRLREHRISNIDVEIAQLSEVSEGRRKESEQLREHLGSLLGSLQPLLSSLQGAAQLARELEIVDPNKQTLDALWDDRVKFTVPAAPSTSLGGLKLSQRLGSMLEINTLLANQLLIKGMDFQLLNKGGVLDKTIATTRNNLISHRTQVMELAKLTIEPKHACVVRGVFKLLGYPEKKFKKWGDARKLFTAPFFKALLQLDPENAKTLENLKLAEAEIEGLKEAAVAANSASVGYLFSFIHAQVVVRDAKEKAAEKAKEAAEKAARDAEAAAEAAAAEAEAAPAEE